MDYAAGKEEISRADVLVDIGLQEVDAIKMKNIDKSIVYAEKVMKKNIPQIKEKIKQWIENNN